MSVETRRATHGRAGGTANVRDGPEKRAIWAHRPRGDGPRDLERVLQVGSRERFDCKDDTLAASALVPRQ